MTLDLPKNNIGEITLIGTGGGYGESMVLHLGDNIWFVIDSCINPKSGKSLPLEYLRNIGVNIAQDVKLILCTHWHDDHIRGMSELIKECESAEFGFAEVTDRKKFLQFVTLDYQKLKDSSISDSSTREFNESLEIIRNRKSPIVIAKENTTLKSFIITGGVRSKIAALSPSDSTILKFHHEISNLITAYGAPRIKLPIDKPNAKSVVLLISMGNHSALLGSDLEVSLDDSEGWVNILDRCTVLDNKASLFKISHHGSENGFHQRVFDELLVDKPITKLTPWNKKDKLPNIIMLQKYISLSSALYMTSPVITQPKIKKRDKETQKLIDRFDIKLEEISFTYGLVRNRIDITNENDKWSTEVHESGFKLHPE